MHAQETMELSQVRLIEPQVNELPSIDPKSEREACKSRMIASGWCHHRVNYLATRYRPDTLTYFSSLDYLRGQKHNTCRTSLSCVAYSVDNSTYQTRHVRPDCFCVFLETPFEDLKRIAEAGGVPLIEIEKYNELPQYRLKVRKRKRSSRYVAISHVWADGLGNPVQCALPCCQIERLYETVKRVLRLPSLGGQDNDGSVLLWMNTLCIPPSDPVIRMAQIDKMASIYKGARTCLIMDAELMALDFKCNASAQLTLELCARVVCSAWNSRSWTLQEVALPKHRTVLFANNDLAVLRDEFRFPGDVKPQLAIYNDRLFEQAESKREKHIRNDLRMSYLDPNWRTFTAIWNELAGRTTSQPADIPLIISNLLTLQTGNLLTYHMPEEQYQAILLGCKTIPLSIFSNSGPRYHGEKTGKAGNTWIPTAIGSKLLRPSPQVHVRSDGLRYERQSSGQCALYILQGPALPLPKHLHFIDGHRTYRFEPADLYLDEADTQANVETCIILDPLDYDGDAQVSFPPTRRGSCFSVVSKRRNMIRMSFRGPLQFMTETEYVNETLCAEVQNKNMKFEILYDFLPGVKRVRRRWETTDISAVFAWTLALPVSLATTFAFMIWRHRESQRTPLFAAWLVGLFVATVVGSGITGIIKLCFGRIATWRDIRAYERIRRDYETPAVTGGEERV